MLTENTRFTQTLYGAEQLKASLFSFIRFKQVCLCLLQLSFFFYKTNTQYGLVVSRAASIQKSVLEVW